MGTSAAFSKCVTVSGGGFKIVWIPSQTAWKGASSLIFAIIWLEMTFCAFVSCTRSWTFSLWCATLSPRKSGISSIMMTVQSSTHSSQMNTVGPTINFLTSCWDFPQKLQYSVSSFVVCLSSPICTSCWLWGFWLQSTSLYLKHKARWTHPTTLCYNNHIMKNTATITTWSSFCSSTLKSALGGGFWVGGTSLLFSSKSATWGGFSLSGRPTEAMFL